MKPPRQFAQMPHVSCASGASSSAATCFMKQSVESSHADDVLQQVGRRLRGRDEMGEGFFVLFPMQEKRVCRLTVASRSADLLVVGDEVLRKLEMNDETVSDLSYPMPSFTVAASTLVSPATQLAMKNAIATRNRLREGAGKRRRGTRRATAEADTRRDRRERSIQFAKYCEIIDSHNFASCFTPLERSEAR